MNDKIHHDGKGGFETESFRVKSFRVCDCVLPEPRMKCSENGTGSYCAKCSGVFKVNAKEFTKNIKASRIHFLDTPAGRDWDNIVSWRNAQKENKKNK
jgi:hypothetical protein